MSCFWSYPECQTFACGAAQWYDWSNCLSFFGWSLWWVDHPWLTQPAPPLIQSKTKRVHFWGFGSFGCFYAYLPYCFSCSCQAWSPVNAVRKFNLAEWQWWSSFGTDLWGLLGNSGELLSNLSSLFSASNQPRSYCFVLGSQNLHWRFVLLACSLVQ